MATGGIVIPRLLALVLGLGFATVAHASPPFFVHQKLAARGEVAPRAGGGVFWSFPGGLWVNAAGAVVFRAELNGGTSNAGLFHSHGGELEALVLRGDPAPASSGGSFNEFSGEASFNDAGALAFVASVSGGPGGLFLAAGGVLTPIVLEGDPLPEAPESSFYLVESPSLNDAGTVAFIGSSELGEAIYVREAGVTLRVVGEGDPAPGGRTFSNFASVALDDSGDLLFFGDSYAAGPGLEGLYRVSEGEISRVAAEGDPAPGTDGGSYSSFDLATPDLAGGDVVFNANVAGGSVPIGLFRVSGGVHSALALHGEPAPAAIGGVYDYLDTRPRVNELADVAFRAWSQASGFYSYGLLLIRDGVPMAVALAGDPAPGTAGGVYGTFEDGSALSDLGAVAFITLVHSGNTQRAIFLAEPPLQSVPAFAPAGWFTLVLALLASGWLNLPARRARAR